MSRSIAVAEGPDFVTLAGDVAERAVTAAPERFDRVGTPVNSADVFIGAAFTDYTPKTRAEWAVITRSVGWARSPMW